MLFPLDTLKTRLQSKNYSLPLTTSSSGRPAVLYRGLLQGVGPALLVSAPSAALFFYTYEHMKSFLLSTNVLFHGGADNLYTASLIASLTAEWCACSLRVPGELFKQRRQIGTPFKVIVQKLLENGKLSFLGRWTSFYKGYGATLCRELPFAAIQLPLLEYFKVKFLKYKTGKYQSLPSTSQVLPSTSHTHGLQSHEVALCGSLAGGIAAALTTPLDVLKTRVMLSQDNQQLSAFKILKNIIHEEGPSKLFSGIGPRVAWITLGGGIFFGMFDFWNDTTAMLFSTSVD